MFRLRLSVASPAKGHGGALEPQGQASLSSVKRPVQTYIEGVVGAESYRPLATRLDFFGFSDHI